MNRVWWPRSPTPGNLGDVLTPLILRAFGIGARWTALNQADLLATGSIARLATKRHAVWGSGVIDSGDRIEPRARWLAVRGPLTRQKVLRTGGTCPEVYGDPALLLPRFHNGTVEAVHEIGAVPHYRDIRRGLADEIRAQGVASVISPLSADPLTVVDRIRQCKAVISSSLHGIIVAHAYGIPAAWLATDRINGDGIKFRDYAASVGIELVPYRTIGEAVPVAPGSLDTQPLVDALEAVR